MQALRNRRAELAVRPEELGRPVADVGWVVHLLHRKGLGSANTAWESRSKSTGGGENHHESGEDGHVERGRGARDLWFVRERTVGDGAVGKKKKHRLDQVGVLILWKERS